MAISLTRHRRAQLIIATLGIALVIALWPYATGLFGAPVLAVIFRTPYNKLAARMRPRLAAAAVVVTAAVILIVPGISVAAIAVAEAQRIAADFGQSPALSQLQEFKIGDLNVGMTITRFSETAVDWVGTSAFRLIGTATRIALNLTIAFFGFYFLLLAGESTWETVRPYIPFTDNNAERLRKRFRDVTNSTIIGSGLTALAQGILVGIAFVASGLSHASFWGSVTAILSVLPIVGSGLVWGPAGLFLLLTERYATGVVMLLWGLLVVASVDNIIRPLVYKRWAKVHPLITLVGALGGVRFFGILGLLIGPLALSYFFELIVMFRDEYLLEEDFLQIDSL